MPTATRADRPALRPKIPSALAQVAADSVAVLRMAYGLVVAGGAVRFLARGWVDELYLAPTHHLTYRGFEWVQPLPGPLLHLHVAALAALGLAIAVGYHHRWCTGLFVIGFAYTELLEASLYLNHYWFLTLVGVLLWLLPVQHRWSLDAAAGRVTPSPTVPAAVVWAFRAQVGAVYVFAGLGKLDGDWLLRAQPLRLWLADRTHVPVVGPVLDEPMLAFVASWAGAAFDCTIVAWLCWRRSRPFAYVVLVAFHLVTAALFQIGIFPWAMIACATIFFAPDWPARCVATARRHPLLVRVAIARFRVPRLRRPRRGVRRAELSAGSLAVLVAMAVVQAVVPLRHHLHDGDVAWTEEGYYLSWRVMLTEKAGAVTFRVTDPATGRTWEADPSLVLTDWQASHAATRPDLVQATAFLLAAEYAAQGHDVEVRADAWATINGAVARRLIDPDVDLVSQPRGRLPDGWILPRGAP